MNVRTKLTLGFSISVATIMLAFSLVVYLFSAAYREDEFFDRLIRRAKSTAEEKVAGLGSEEVPIAAGRKVYQPLPQEKIYLFDQAEQLIYASTDEAPAMAWLEGVHHRREGRKVEGEVHYLCFVYPIEGEEYVVLASARDLYGFSKLRNLRKVLGIGMLVGFGIILLAGWFFAKRILQPLSKLNDEISKINAGNLNRRVDEGNRSDEIASLAINFNKVLSRLETAFEMQQSFVSNASHELRTPLATMRSQLQVSLSKYRSAEDYRTTLQSLLEDTEAFVRLTTSLLQLAQSNVSNPNSAFMPCRVDEALFLAQAEVSKLYPDFRFQMDYDNMPDEEASLTVLGNEVLLTTAFMNLMENAYKFSPDRTVSVSLVSGEQNITVRFTDNGIGIPLEEQPKIFSPFQRASNAQGMSKGHGIGLSLCQRIIQLHNGSIHLKSARDKGSQFTVILPL